MVADLHISSAGFRSREELLVQDKYKYFKRHDRRTNLRLGNNVAQIGQISSHTPHTVDVVSTRGQHTLLGCFDGAQVGRAQVVHLLGVPGCALPARCAEGVLEACAAALSVPGAPLRLQTPTRMTTPCTTKTYSTSLRAVFLL